MKYSANQINSDLGGNLLIAEGSGVDTKYYIQQGADTASKKLLGSCPPITLRLDRSGLGQGIAGVQTTVFSADISGYNKLDATYSTTYIYSGGYVEGITTGGKVTRILDANTTYDKNVKSVDISNYATFRLYCSTEYSGNAHLTVVFYN